MLLEKLQVILIEFFGPDKKKYEKISSREVSSQN